MIHSERHRAHRIGWLRAAVLGANDGILSTASLVVGVATADASHASVVVAGLAGLAAGAMSMAAGEYVSVSSQGDTERADLERERSELAADPEGEVDELTQIYQERGLDEPLARQVAVKLMEYDALGTHLRDELGISEIATARPVQAALASAATFAVGAALPLLTAVLCPQGFVAPVVACASLASLALLGSLSASAGGAPRLRAVARVTLWGAFAMALTAGVGAISGAVSGVTP